MLAQTNAATSSKTSTLDVMAFQAQVMILPVILLYNITFQGCCLAIFSFLAPWHAMGTPAFHWPDVPILIWVN